MNKDIGISRYFITYYDSVLGRLTLCQCGDYITHVRLEKEVFSQEAYLEQSTELLLEAVRQLNAYLKGDVRQFDLPLSPQGTPFMQKVWSQLTHIPYGLTSSYKDIAISLGQAGAARAVGMACNRNPLPIFIPCHRVIGSNGSLTGYSGGLEIKQKLLDLEQMHRK